MSEDACAMVVVVTVIKSEKRRSRAVFVHRMPQTGQKFSSKDRPHTPQMYTPVHYRSSVLLLPMFNSHPHTTIHIIDMDVLLRMRAQGETITSLKSGQTSKGD